MYINYIVFLLICAFLILFLWLLTQSESNHELTAKKLSEFDGWLKRPDTVRSEIESKLQSLRTVCERMERRQEEIVTYLGRLAEKPERKSQEVSNQVLKDLTGGN